MAILSKNEVFKLPPEEAIKSFREKGYKIGFDWRDTSADEHAHAFTVAKAMQLDVLADLRQGVDKALAEGTSLQQFTKELRPLLQKKGWWGEKELTDPVTGEVKTVQLGSPRRLKTIYDTNLRTRHAAGRWKRIEDNAARRPYLRYFTKRGGNRRAEHQEFQDMVRPVSDPIWRVLYPPNGFGCQCGVQQLSERDLKRFKLTVSNEVALEYRKVVNARTGEVRNVPKGVDPGWDHNAGLVSRAANPLAKYPVLEPVRTFADYNRPPTRQLTSLPKQPPNPGGNGPLDTFRRVFDTTDGSPEALIKDPQGVQVSFSEDQLLDHVAGKSDGRERWFAHAKSAVEDPFEVWMVPYRKKNGQVVMRRRYVSIFEGTKKEKAVLVVVEDNGAITSLPFSRIDRQRQGYLLYSRDES